MAVIDDRGFVDDGTNRLNVAGGFSAGLMTSSAGSFGLLSTFSNNLSGQTLSSPNTFTIVSQWFTSSLSTPGVTSNVSSSITINQPGWYMTLVSLSFSGSAGTYSFNVFKNGQRLNCQRQDNIDVGQSFPVGVSILDFSYYNNSDLLDVRVKCTNADAGFQMNNGSFIVFRVVG